MSQHFVVSFTATHIHVCNIYGSNMKFSNFTMIMSRGKYQLSHF